MFTSIEPLQLNRFKQVCCVKARDLYSRIGPRASVPFPSSEESIPMNMNKLEQIEYLERYDSMMQSNSDSSTVNDSSANQHYNNDDSSGEA